MLDILGELETAKLKRKQDYILITELLDFLKATNITANFAEIVDYLLDTLKEYNLETADIKNLIGLNGLNYIIKTYLAPKAIPRFSSGENICFFKAIETVKRNYLKHNSSLQDNDVLEIKNEFRSCEFIGKKYVNVFLSRPQIEELLGIKIPVDESYLATYKEKRKFYLVGELSKLEDNSQNNVQNLIGTTREYDLKATVKEQETELTKLKTQIAELAQKDQTIANQADTIQQQQARIAELEKNQAQSASNSNEVLEYGGEIPPNTNQEKLADFIDLLIDVGNIKNKQGLKPTYSELHTILRHKAKNRRVPSKNTIQKYMNKDVY